MIHPQTLLSQIEIQPYSDQDKKPVKEFCISIWQEMGWEVEYLEGMDDLPKFLHFPEGFFFVIKDQNRVIGCAGVKKLTDSQGLIKRYYISHELRGSGAAGLLLQKLIDESKRRGLTELVLDVYFKNPRAIAFYEKNGFQRFDPKIIEDWPETTEPEIYFYYKLKIS